MTEEYEALVDNFKPEFGNQSHIRISKLIGEIAKGQGREEELEMKRSQVIYLIKQKNES